MANKYLDYDGLLYFWAKLKAYFVAQESGKGLSTNDYTTAEKNKLSGIASGAQVNVIETVKRNGTALTVTSKAVDISVPTATSELTNDSDFVEDANYVHTDNNFSNSLKNKLDGIASGATVDDHKWRDVTLVKSVGSTTDDVYVPYLVSTSATSCNVMLAKASPTASVIARYNSDKMLSSFTPSATDNSTLVATTAFVKTAIENATPTIDTAMSSTSTNAVRNNVIKAYVDDAVGSITGISFEIVQSLPQTGSTGVIYLVAHAHATGDIYDEYIWISSSSSFEKIGSTDIDLSGYMLKSDMVAITNTEIDTIVAT